MTYAFDSTQRCALEGEIVYGSKSGIQTPVAVRIVFPDTYPAHEPRAYDPASRFVHDADGHFFNDGESDGRCCLWLAWESGWTPKDPQALRPFLDQVALFFHRQLVFEATGRQDWPGPARDHGVRGYYDYLCEALGVDDDGLRRFWARLEQYGYHHRFGACPCGSGRSYRECHLAKVTEIVNTVGQGRLEHQLATWRRQGYPGLQPAGRPLGNDPR